MNKLISRIDQAIKYCFYLIFFLVPLVIYPSTFELFEFNKMWVTFGIVLVVAFLWLSKIIITGKITIRRTPLDIPILLFLASQIISTVISLDRHVSIWGYYSRFNGGLASTISYIFLYYAFASNLVANSVSGSGIAARIGDVKRHALNHTNRDNETQTAKPISYKMLLVSLITGAVVALWGLPSHFGYDPTCLIFRGTLDVACWTESFQPKVRIFSLLGQPNWLAAYLAILLPVSLSFFLKNIINIDLNSKHGNKFSIFNPAKAGQVFQFSISKKSTLLATCYLLLAILFYVDLIYTGSQSGFAAAWIGILVFFGLVVFFEIYQTQKFRLSKLLKALSVRVAAATILLFLLIAFFVGMPILQLEVFTLKGIQTRLSNQNTSLSKPDAQEAKTPVAQVLGGSDSGEIRRIVWRGALDVFRLYPLFGSGVETFAYAYYKVKPKEHNLTSEWDFLYNKAHNEYLNYLATTGAFGLGSYLLLIGWFLITAIKQFKMQNAKWSLRSFLTSSKIKMTIQNSKLEKEKLLTLSFALIASYVTILVSNFFGFSVVIVNLYFFLIPLLVFELCGATNISNLNFKVPFLYLKENETARSQLPSFHIMLILMLALLTFYFEFLLIRFWVADQKYAQGYNLDKFAGLQGYIDGQPYLFEAVSLRPGEDLFKDELSVNLSTLALIAQQQGQATEAANLARQATDLSDGVVERHPENVVYYKTRTRVFYNLSQIDPSYFEESLKSIDRAYALAPTDAKILYNKALLFAQINKKDEAIKTFMDSIDLKPNYIDPRYSLAQYYLELAKEETNRASEYRKLALDQLEFILNNIDSENSAVKDLLETIN